MTAEALDRDRGRQVVMALFEAHHAELYAYLCRLVHDPQWAEDLTQDAFLRLLRTRDRLPAVRNRRAWLYRVATNLALTALKRRNRFAWLPWRTVEERLEGGQDPARALPGDDRVQRALAGLPPTLRAPLLLYAHHELPVAEVADILGLTEGAVKTRLYRARRRFRELYERECDA